jgi:hypothetical protein
MLLCLWPDMRPQQCTRSAPSIGMPPTNNNEDGGGVQSEAGGATK